MGIPAFESQRGDIRAELIKNKCHNTFKGNMMTRHGNDNEDMIRDMAMDILGLKVLEFGLLVHKDHPWLGASPDGVTTTGALIEIKAPYRRQPIANECPHHYYPQVQVQLEVCDLDLCYFVQWMPPHLSNTGTEILTILPIERDRAWFAKYCPTFHAFWHDLMEARRVFVAPPPPPPPTCLIVDDLYNGTR